MWGRTPPIHCGLSKSIILLQQLLYLVSCRLEREHEINAAGGAANPLILKNPVTHRQSSLLVWHGHFDWQVYQLCFQEWFENSSLTCKMPRRKASQDCLRKDLLYSMILNFTLKQHLPKKITTWTRDGEPGFDCFIWQPHLAFTSPFIAGKHSLICTTTPDPWAVFTQPDFAPLSSPKERLLCRHVD